MATLRLGPRTFTDGETIVMAIVNRTPDSFSGRGAAYDEHSDRAALDQVRKAIEDGAAIIDIGGVKAGHGDPVSETEELRRTVPFLARVRERHPDIVVSADTWRAPVGRALCEAGADLINDTWSGADPELAGVAAEFGAGLVCSHTGLLPPRTDPHRVAYEGADGVVGDVLRTVQARADRALAAGVRPDGILIDPTHDFGKNTWHSLELTRHLDRLVATGWPVLVALSRKDFIGETLDLPVDDRLSGTLAATAVSAWLGARVFRAHDVRETRQVLDMVASIGGVRAPTAARRGLA